jgi:uncharacterized coiled-coil DUF342 family protein
MPAKQAAAASSALVAQPTQDPLELQIQEVEQAIEEVRTSKDPVYIAAPHKRGDLLEQLHERIAHLKQVQADRAQAAAEKLRRDQLKHNWERLSPKRAAMVERWNKFRAEARQLIADIKELDSEHLSKCEKRAFSESISKRGLLYTRFEQIDGGVVLARPEDL